MRRWRIWGVPTVLLVLFVTWMVVDAVQTKRAMHERYAVPLAHDPHTLLQFMRKMDGSIEHSQLLFTKSNIESVCSAVLNASELIQPNLSMLSVVEQREALFYRTKFLGYSLAFGYQPTTDSSIHDLLTQTKSFMAAAESFGRREEVVSELTMLALDGDGRAHEELDFLHWLNGQVQAWPTNPAKDLFAEKMNRVAARLELTAQSVDLQSFTLEGNAFDLQSLQGKVVLIEFWGTHCQHCIQELPALQRIYRTYRDRGFEMVGVCLNAEPERIRAFVAEHHITWTELCDDKTLSSECNSTLADRFGIHAVPTTLLIDGTGKVVAQGVRPLHRDEDLDLERWLARLMPAK